MKKEIEIEVIQEGGELTWATIDKTEIMAYSEQFEEIWDDYKAKWVRASCTEILTRSGHCWVANIEYDVFRKEMR